MINTENSQCEICKIFSNKHRLKILVALRDSSKTVSDIVKITNASQSATSQHLSMMKLRGILDIEKKGAFVYYKIRYPEVMQAFDIMKKVTKKINGESYGK